jgi:hypothetical protein
LFFPSEKEFWATPLVTSEKSSTIKVTIYHYYFPNYLSLWCGFVCPRPVL